MNTSFYNFIIKNVSKEVIPKNKKILITGANGFIGQYLVEALANIFSDHNNVVYGIDINENKKKHKKYIYYKRNLYNLKKKSIPKVKFDYIIHLAGIPSPVYYKKFPLETIYLNTELARELLELCLKNKSKFIYFSSSEIYGNPFDEFIPTNENYNGNVSSVGDRSCYDESKRMGETFTYTYKEKFNVNAKIIRPFNFYGDMMRYNDERIIPKFFYQNLNNKNITIYSTGKQTRSYCHIFDATVMMLMIIFKGKNFIYNVGNPLEEINAERLAKKIIKITKNNKKKFKIVSYPNNYPSDEPRRRCPSIKTFLTEFEYKPKIKLDEGLKFFLQYAKKNFI